MSSSVASSDALAVRVNAHARSFKRAGQLAAGLVAVALAAFAYSRYRTKHAAPTARYETVTVDEGPLDASVTATGALSPLISVQVGSQVSGRIERLYADFQSVVKQGQIVATIEPSLFRAAVAQARANLAVAAAALTRNRAQKLEADRQYARNAALLSQGLISRADYDVSESNVSVAAADIASAEASIAQARAALDQAELNLKYTTIVSPIDGVVISRNVDVGQTVAAALQAPTLFTIAQDLTKMQVDASIAEADVGKIQPQMPVGFSVDAYPGRTFSGIVRQIRDNAQTIQNVVTYDAVIDVDNRERMLKPGMTANVTVSYAKRPHSLRIPQAAIRFKPDHDALKAMTNDEHPSVPATHGSERAVWVLRGTRPSPLVVEIGVSDGSNAEVISGPLKAGDRLVVEVVKAAP